MNARKSWLDGLFDELKSAVGDVLKDARDTFIEPVEKEKTPPLNDPNREPWTVGDRRIVALLGSIAWWPYSVGAVNWINSDGASATWETLCRIANARGVKLVVFDERR